MSKFEKGIMIYYVFFGFFAAVFGIVVMCMPVVQRIEITERILSLAYWVIYPSYCYIIIRTAKKQREAPYANEAYYAKQFQNGDNLNNIIETGIVFYVKAILFPAIVTVIITLVSWREIFIPMFEQIHITMWKNSTLPPFLEEIIVVYTFLFCFFSIIIANINDKCMFFGPYELPVIKRCNIVTIITLSLATVYAGTYVLANSINWLLGIEDVMLLILIVLNILMYIWAFAVPINIEKRVVKRIYRIYPGKKIYVTPRKKWYKGNTIRQLEKVLKKYEKVVGKLKVDNIDSIKFGCILSSKKINIEWAIRRYYALAIIVVIVSLVCAALCSKAFDLTMRIIYVCISFLGILPIFYPLFNKKVIADNYQYINRIAYISEWGYYIKLKDKNKKIYVSVYDFPFCEYRNSLIKLKQIVCFYNLAIKMKYEDMESADEVITNAMCDYVEDMFKQKKAVKRMIVPLLICMELSEKSKNARMKKIKEVINKLNVNPQEQEMLINISILILREMYGDDEIFEKKKNIYFKEYKKIFIRKN